MSFFKKKDEDRKTIRPKLRPANFGTKPKEKSGTSGKGGGEATPTYDTSAPDWSKQVASFNKKGGINNDGRFGYGYVDTQTGIEVPWYIDMINGGGANAAGDTFVSPFEGTSMGLPAQAVTGGLNALNVAPYGYNRPRYFMPMEAARVDAEGKPVQVDLGAATRPTGGGSPTAATPTFVSAPTTDVSIGQGNTTPLSYGDQRPPEAIGINEILLNRNRGFQPTISPLTMPAASVANPNYATYVGKPVTQIETYPSMFSTGVNTDFTPAYDPAMFGSDITTSTDVGRRRMDNLNTIPATSVGTKEAKSYEEYLRAGGQLLFPEYVSAYVSALGQ